MLATARRETVFVGIGALAAAVALLAASSDGVSSLARAGLGALGLIVAGGGSLLFVRYPAVVPVVVLVAAPSVCRSTSTRSTASTSRSPAAARPGACCRCTPCSPPPPSLAYRLVRGAEVRPLPRELAAGCRVRVAASLSVLWAEAEGPAVHLLEYFLLPFVALVAVVAFAPVEAWLPRVLAIVAVALASLFAVVGLLEEATQRLIFYTPAVEIGNAYSSFFRVTSLFRDPSLYGRHVVLGLAVVIVLLWSRRLGIALAVVIAGLLFAGLFFSYPVQPDGALRRAARRRGARRRPARACRRGRDRGRWWRAWRRVRRQSGCERVDGAHHQRPLAPDRAHRA